MVNWLTNAAVYEIYPQSFLDTNGDGIGDLQGVIAKLDYIHSLGFDAIWLNPINASSFRDAGYDVTDFYAVDPRYGTLEDYKMLTAEVHKRGMKIFFDLVAGHTSVDHPWFQESSKIEQNQYTNRYIWNPGAFEGGPGIAGVGERDAKYIANFFWSQPALNYGYANPTEEWQLPVDHPDCQATRQELKNIISFWMDLGTDGFRVDMAASLIKADPDRTQLKILWHEIKDLMYHKNPESVLIAEWGFPNEAIDAGFDLDFYLHSGSIAYTSLFRYEKGRNTTLSMGIGHSYFNCDGKGNINTYLDQITDDLATINNRGYIGHITGNHDMPRLAYRRTPEEVKIALAFLFTMPGVPFVYYGDEIGMDYIEGLPSKEGGYIRTGCRTPMQWNHGKNHGFSTSDMPYLPTDSRTNAPTVEDQKDDETSILNTVKKLIALRKEYPALWADGEFEILEAGYPVVYKRKKGEQTILVAINPSDRPRNYETSAISQILFSQNAHIEGHTVHLSGVSVLVALINK